jgi:colicin import membrane protein
MAYYTQFINLLTYMEQTTPNEFGETLMEMSAEAAATLAAETDEERATRAAAEEWKQDFKALLLFNMAETKRISNTYRGRSSEIGKVMEAAVLNIRTAYFEAKAEAKAEAQAKAQAIAESMAQAKAKAQAKAQVKADAQAEEEN